MMSINETLVLPAMAERFLTKPRVNVGDGAMQERLRIVVADDEPDMREYFARILPRLGHQVVAAAADGCQLVEQCLEHLPDLVITDICMPGMDGIQAAEQLYLRRPIPVILVSAHHDPELIARAEADHVMAYLVKPIKQSDLAPALAIACRRFQQFEHVRREADDLCQALAEHRLVEQAQAHLMRQAGLDAPAAFARLRELARRSQQKLVETARRILAADHESDAGPSDRMPASLEDRPENPPA
jgi:AmiR/NasT family two-component response regulator